MVVTLLSGAGRVAAGLRSAGRSVRTRAHAGASMFDRLVCRWADSALSRGKWAAEVRAVEEDFVAETVARLALELRDIARHRVGMLHDDPRREDLAYVNRLRLAGALASLLHHADPASLLGPQLTDVVGGSGQGEFALYLDEARKLDAGEFTAARDRVLSTLSPAGVSTLLSQLLST